ncbi:MAG: DUF1015 domain-containing protein [Treponematales bacterium]
MKDTAGRLAALGARAPEVLLPGAGVDAGKWAVIACDQFTQDKAYWERARAFTGGAPSTLNLVLPEAFLGGGDSRERTQDIHRTMREYLAGGVFAAPRRCCVYLERIAAGRLRRGLVLALDLEAYDGSAGAKSLVRATEGTVPERLPARMEARRGAALECPHIIVLVEDREDRLLPGLGALAKRRAGGKEPLYDTGLMLGGGHVTGWALEGPEAEEALAAGLEGLAERALSRYGGETPFLFAVGDGNHSLAAAKAVWEEVKASRAGLAEHPARYALVEVENLYDEGIRFEPIHRAVFHAEPREVARLLEGLPGFRCRDAGGRCLAIESAAGVGGGAALVTPVLEPLLEGFCEAGGGRFIDYIHGEEELRRVASAPGREAVGLLLPPLRKEGLFGTVARTGPLPRKSFSLGEALEKRFYMECRGLFP